MSAITTTGEKTFLPRCGADEFWSLVCAHYADQDARKWKYLAMLALRENAGWPLDRIGLAFQHPKGHITRCLANVKQELRDRFHASPDFLSFNDPEEEESDSLAA
jgi:hypothetical protein